MNVEFYERIWMWLAVVVLAVFAGVVLLSAGVAAVHAPSHMETVDPQALKQYPEFARPAVRSQPDGSVVVSVVASMYSFAPDPIEIPANKPVTFRITSEDVVHGFEVAGTNANAMAIPGYVSQFTMTFPKPGEYLIGCNEYCGLAHHNMVGKLIVKEAQK
jgi:cytochrome c oxidase subunit II